MGDGRRLFAVLACVLLLLSGAGCTTDDDGDEGTEDGTVPLRPFNMTSIRTDFEDPVYEPRVRDYGLPVQREYVRYLDAVESELDLDADRVGFLLENGLVGISDPPEDFTRFYDAYDRIYWDYDLPLLYTSDSVLDAYHHMYEAIMVELEGTTLRNELYSFSERMMVLSQMQYNELPQEHRQLAADNVVYFGVAVRLLDPDTWVKPYAEEDIEGMVSLIEAAEGTVTPPGFHRLEDLTQYKVRSHYTASEGLMRYFRAMTWYGRMTFHGDEDDETRRAVMASLALRDDHVANTSYSKLASAISFLVGWPDDLNFLEYCDASDRVFGPMGPDLAPLFDDGELQVLQDSLRELRPPKIGSDMTAPGETVWGLRFLGQAYVVDSHVFQECTFEEVPDRFTPSALDVMAALGSQEAWDREDFDAYDPAFEENLGGLRDEVADLDEGYWNSSLYNGWLHCLQALDQNTSAEGFPAFMRTDAWRAKQLNAQLGSWTQLVHDTQLYRKQTYTYMGISAPDAIYVEPVPELYSRMGRMVDATLSGLASLGLMTKAIEDNLGNLSRVLTTFETYSIAELEGTEPEYDYETMVPLRFAYKYMLWQPTRGSTHEGRTVLVADVHTLHDASAPLQYLEEAVGYVRLVIVVAPTEDGPIACVGPVFEHYEFPRTASAGRLTDEEWEAMLEDGTAPEPAPWAQDFNP